MRGKEGFLCWRSRQNGITPAYAGKGPRHCSIMGLHRDHPRVCGERRAFYAGGAGRTGSPPRMRGKDLGIALSWGCIGITPAYAGKGGLFMLEEQAERDHPRVCGERTSALLYHGAASGSPPRMRGKEGFLCWRSRQNGITPAYAGKGPLRGKGAAPLWDHPRVCGERYYTMIQRI